jgi:hypothetical protein
MTFGPLACGLAASPLTIRKGTDVVMPLPMAWMSNRAGMTGGAAAATASGVTGGNGPAGT